MKKSNRKIIALFLVFLLLFSLASCGKRPQGTYTAAGITLTFEGDTFTVEKGDAKGSGTYEIVEAEDGTMRIFFTFGQAEGSYATTFSSILISPDGGRFDMSESYVKIAGIPFAKKTAE